MNYSGNHSRYIPSLTENEKFLTKNGYKPHLNKTLTIIKADGTITTEKALTQHQLDNLPQKPVTNINSKTHKKLMKKQKQKEGNRRAQISKTTPTVPEQIN